MFQLPTFEGSPDDTLGYIDLQFNPQPFKLPHSSSQSKFNSLPNIKSRRRSHYISNIEGSIFPRSDRLDNLTMEVVKPKDTETKTTEPTKDEDTVSKTSESTTVVISTSDSVCSDSPRGVTNEAFEEDEEVDSSCKKGHRRSPSQSQMKDEKGCDVSYSSSGSTIEIPVLTKDELKAKEPQYQYIVPDTQLRKGWRGEKLYFAKGTADSRADRHVRRFCWWMVCLVLLAGAITVAALIGVGVIKLPLHTEAERIHSYHSGERAGPRLGQVRNQDAPQGSIIETIVLYNTRTEEEERVPYMPEGGLGPSRTEYPTQAAGTEESDVEAATEQGKISTETTTDLVLTQTAPHTTTFLTTQPEELGTQTEQVSTQPEQISTQTEQISKEAEQVSTQPEQVSAQPELFVAEQDDFSTQTVQVTTQREPTLQTTMETELKHETKKASPEFLIPPVETTKESVDQATETLENEEGTEFSDVVSVTTQAEIFAVQETTQAVVEESQAESSGQDAKPIEELGSGEDINNDQIDHLVTDEKLKTISVEDLFTDSFEASGDFPETDNIEQLELNTDYVMTRESVDDNEKGEMELVITLPKLLSGTFRDIIDGDSQDGSGDNVFELNQPPESDDVNDSFENGEDVFKALLDLILPKKSEKLEEKIEKDDLSLGELIKHIGSQ
jgi:hypothetical protein